MSRAKRILLYGNSVILGCLGASLRLAGQFEIVHVAPPLPGLSELEALEPDVLLFDADNANSEAVFSLLRCHPDLLVVSVSPDGNIVRLWSGQQYRELSTTDLTALIEDGSQAEAASRDQSAAAPAT
jgi:hypothetical protein